MINQTQPARESGWRAKLYHIIFEAETPVGKAFDVGLLLAILISVGAVVAESVEAIELRYGRALRLLEWSLTGLFTVEYLIRLWSVRRPWRYARSFFGLIDLLAVVPTYLSLLIPGSQSLVVVRAIRLLRVFRVLKLMHMLREARMLSAAIWLSRHKIGVFIGAVSTIILIVATLMYVIEGAEHGFTSIPKSIYWAVVTMTTVGYGDIAPQTIPGRALAALVMLIGYSIIAVPTGIVTIGLSEVSRQAHSTFACPACGRAGHDPDARYCKHCGESLASG